MALNSVVKRTGLPKWWVVGKDDFLMLEGVHTHGFLNWELILKNSPLFRSKPATGACHSSHPPSIHMRCMCMHVKCILF